MEKQNCVLNLYNGLTRYYEHVIYYVNGHYTEEAQKQEERLEKVLLTKKDISNAMFSMVAIDLIINKEKLVAKEAGLNYTSKMSDDELNLILDVLVNEEDKLIYKDGPTLLSFIRNKLAHGDYCFNEDQTNLILNTKININENETYREILIDINKFLNFYTRLSASMDYRLKDNTYTKFYVIDLAKDKFKEPITTEKDFQKYLSLLKIKTISIKRKDNKDLTSEEKNIFLSNIEGMKKVLINEKDSRTVENRFREEYEKHGYIVTFNKSKIKDEEQINKMRKAISSTNSYYDKSNIEELTYKYGEEVYKILNIEYQTQAIKQGIRYNEVLLENMYTSGDYDFIHILENSLKEEAYNIMDYIHEMVLTMSLSRFYTSYCYPLESIYKKTNAYHINRCGELPFQWFDLSELTPSKMDIKEVGIDDIKIKLHRMSNNISDLQDTIIKKYKNINGLDNKQNKSEKEMKKLKDFREEIIRFNNTLNYLNKTYIDLLNEAEIIKFDYSKNKKYFENRTIIEGMRNAIAHGNISVENIAQVDDKKDLLIKFTDYENDELVFELTASLYELESLFEGYNLNISNYILCGQNENQKVKK